MLRCNKIWRGQHGPWHCFCLPSASIAVTRPAVARSGTLISASSNEDPPVRLAEHVAGDLRITGNEYDRIVQCASPQPCHTDQTTDCDHGKGVKGIAVTRPAVARSGTLISASSNEDPLVWLAERGPGLQPHWCVARKPIHPLQNGAGNWISNSRSQIF